MDTSRVLVIAAVTVVVGVSGLLGAGAASAGDVARSCSLEPGGTCPRINLEERDLRGYDLSSIDLRRADLSDAILRGVDLRGADLRGADLRGTDLRGALLGPDPQDYVDGHLSGRGKPACAPMCQGADLRGADLRGADLTHAFLGLANLSGAHMGCLTAQAECTNLTFAMMMQVDLTDADLRGANLTGAILAGSLGSPGSLPPNAPRGHTILPGADLTGANLSGAYLTRLDLTGLRMSGVDLTCVKPPENYWRPTGCADLSGADLSGSDLANSDLSGADLTNANLTNAILAGVTWTGATCGDGQQGPYPCE